MIIIGLGSGRCGTTSLASLLNSQEGTVCFHEINASCMAWTGTEVTVLSMLNEFRAVLSEGVRNVTVDLVSPHRIDPLPRLRSLDTITAIGDVASYYLPYASILAEAGDVVLPVLRREKQATVASFLNIVRIRRSWSHAIVDSLSSLLFVRPYQRFRNHWVRHDGLRWQTDHRFDKCFPKFPPMSLEEAIGRYWDIYYETAEELVSKYPEVIRIFDVEELNTERGQHDILEFCGIRRRAPVPVHANAHGKTSDRI